MTVRITANARTNRIIVGISGHSRMHRQAIREGLYELGTITQREIRRLIINGPKTGRVYKRTGRPDHQASAPNEPPANETGTLQQSVNYGVRDDQMELGYTVSYGRFLELGTRRMRPRPALILGINNTAGYGVTLLNDRVNQRMRRE